MGGGSGQIVGVLTFFTTMVLPLLAYEAVALSAASPPVQLTITRASGINLIGSRGGVFGMFISSLTDSTILAVSYYFPDFVFVGH